MKSFALSLIKKKGENGKQESRCHPEQILRRNGHWKWNAGLRRRTQLLDSTTLSLSQHLVAFAYLSHDLGALVVNDDEELDEEEEVEEESTIMVRFEVKGTTYLKDNESVMYTKDCSVLL